MIIRGHFFCFLLLIFHLREYLVWACSPGPRYGYRHSYTRQWTPFVQGQYFPAVSETTIGASGPRKKPITRDSPEFSSLEHSYNTDIVFLDEEQDGSDRVMTQRCKDKLEILSTMVMDRWPNVRLRVTEAWESRKNHVVDSLHYEGRAVDLSTSDRDITKYGMLARLAVEAGFDWVHYKSKYFIHASVRADNADDAKFGGCFPQDSLLQTSQNKSIRLQDVKVGDRVLSVDRTSGQLLYSDVIMMLDKQPNVSAQFLQIATANTSLTLTKNHLLFAVNDNRTTALWSQTQDWSAVARPIYAEDVTVGQYIFTRQSNAKNRLLPTPTRVISVKEVVRQGLFAPLTTQGTVVVGSTVSSCYSGFESESLAHASFSLARTFEYFRKSTADEFGIHSYPKTLIKFAEYIFPSSYFRYL